MVEYVLCKKKRENKKYDTKEADQGRKIHGNS